MIVLPRPRRSEGRLLNNVAEIDFLGQCAKAYVLAHPAGVRHALIAALSRHLTRCEHDGSIVLVRPLDGGRKARSGIAFAGSLEGGGAHLVLRATACETRGFERIALDGDDGEWMSPRVELSRDGRGCDVAELPYTKTLARTLRQVVDSARVTPAVRFEGANLRIELPDAMRDELRAVLDAVDALSAP